MERRTTQETHRKGSFITKMTVYILRVFQAVTKSEEMRNHTAVHHSDRFLHNVTERSLHCMSSNKNISPYAKHKTVCCDCVRFTAQKALTHGVAKPGSRHTVSLLYSIPRYDFQDGRLVGHPWAVRVRPADALHPHEDVVHVYHSLPRMRAITATARRLTVMF